MYKDIFMPSYVSENALVMWLKSIGVVIIYTAIVVMYFPTREFELRFNDVIISFFSAMRVSGLMRGAHFADYACA